METKNITNKRVARVKIDKAHENQLINDAKQGKRAAIESLIKLHQDRLYAFVWRIVRNDSDAEDICQETFLRAFSSLKDFNEEYRFSTWLFTIGYRLALNHIKHRSARDGFDFSNVTSAKSAQSPEQIVIQSEQANNLRTLIWSEVDNLSAFQRAVMMMFYREGLSCQEIADSLDIPVATVKSHLHRGRDKLRKRLEVKGVDKQILPVLGA